MDDVGKRRTQEEEEEEGLVVDDKACAMRVCVCVCACRREEEEERTGHTHIKPGMQARLQQGERGRTFDEKEEEEGSV